jgi:hypothetical protein
MRFLILSIDTQDGTAKVLLQTDVPAIITQATTALQRQAPVPLPAHFTHGNAKAITVVEVAGDAESILRRGDVFESAQHLDKALGFSYHATSMAMSKARAAGQKTATLRGVTFCFSLDAEEVLLADAKVD